MPEDTLTHLPSSRQEAISKGVPHFFTGVPCKNGHVAKRFTSDKSCMLCRRERTKDWFRNHKEHKQRYDREYNKSHRKAKTELMKKWAKNNPGKAAIHMKNNYALRKTKGARGKLSAEVIAKLLKEQSKKCPYCKASIAKRYHLDHIVALSKGGQHEMKNWQLLCPPCNSKKKDKDAIDFAQEKGLLL